MAEGNRQAGEDVAENGAVCCVSDRGKRGYAQVGGRRARERGSGRGAGKRMRVFLRVASRGNRQGRVSNQLCGGGGPSEGRRGAPPPLARAQQALRLEIVARGAMALLGESEGFCLVQDALRPRRLEAAAEKLGLRGMARTASAARGESG